MKRFKYRALVKLDSAGGGPEGPPLPTVGGQGVISRRLFFRTDGP